jgi:hypothetical protein
MRKVRRALVIAVLLMLVMSVFAWSVDRSYRTKVRAYDTAFRRGGGDEPDVLVEALSSQYFPSGAFARHSALAKEDLDSIHPPFWRRADHARLESTAGRLCEAAASDVGHQASPQYADALNQYTTVVKEITGQ